MADRYWVAAVASTWDNTAGLKWATTSGGVGGASVPGIGDRVFFDGSSPANCAINSVSVSCAGIDATSFGHTLSGNQQVACAGNVNWGGATLTYNGQLTLSGGGAQTFTSNGKTTLGAVIVNAPGGTYTLADAFNSSNTFTHTAGGYVTAGFGHKSTTLLSNGGTTRTLTLDGSLVEVTGTGGVINLANVNLTFSDAGTTYKLSNASATARTITTGGLTLGDVQVTAGSGNLTMSGAFGGFSAVGYSGQLQASSRTFSGNVDFGTAMTFAATTSVTSLVPASGTKTLKCGGVSVQCHINVDCPGATIQLADALTMAAANQLGLVHGTLDPNGKAVTCGFFGSSSTNVRALLGSAGAWTLTGLAPTQEPWNTHTTTNFTFTAPDKVICNDASATTKIFRGGGLAFKEVRFAGAGSGIFQIADANSFAKIGVDTPPHTLQFPHGLTTTLGPAAPFDLSGTAANPNILGSTTGGSTTTVVTCPGNDIVADYLTVDDLRFVGGALFFLGRHSTTPTANIYGARLTDLYRSP